MQETREFTPNSQLPFELPGTFEAIHITYFLHKLGFQPTFFEENSSDPAYYEKVGENIVVLPPASDNEISGTLKNIVTRIEDAYKLKRDILHNQPTLLIPVLEEQQYLGKPRRFWVLLKYEFSTQQLIMLDPTGYMRASAYKTSFMEADFQKGMAGKSSTKNLMQKVYLGVQELSDTTTSGHWIVYFIYRFGVKNTLQDIQEEVKNKTLKLQTVLTLFKTLCISLNESEPAKDMLPIPRIYTPTKGFPPNAEIQQYAMNSSLPLAGLGHTNFNIDVTDIQPKANMKTHVVPYAYFNLNFYSALILSGAALAFISMVCFSSQVAAVTVGMGTMLFAAGLLGKCGLFEVRTNVPETTQSNGSPKKSFDIT